jgi:hypothetical protein
MPTDHRRPEGLIGLVIGSIAISIACLVLLYAAPEEPRMWTACGLLAVGWLVLFLYAVANFGKRGFWLLLGGAPALWVMYIFLAIPFACAFKHACL